MQTKFSKLSYNNCRLCPWNCGVDRTSGKLGICRSANKVKVSSATIHHGEEPMISGTKGSGTIFFSNCSLKCTYCQNFQISQDGLGDEVSIEKLAELMIMLQNKGCHNINLVSPTHYVLSIIKALSIAMAKGLNIPVIYNTNGFENVKTLKALDGLIDIYLPDIKYSNNETAKKLSNTPNYVEFNRDAIKEMFRQVGNLELDDNGIAVKGVLVRHLVLPNDLSGSKESFQFLAKEISSDIHIGIMAQYNPCYKANDNPDINRKITRDEYQKAVNWAKESGLHNILVQELDSSEVFLPNFERTDPFK